MQINRKLVKWSLVTATFALALAGTTIRLAHADRVDCTGVSRWDSDKTYNKGDHVWYPDGPDYAFKEECIVDHCHSVFDGNAPESSSKAWKHLGTCNTRPRS